MKQSSVKATIETLAIPTYAVASRSALPPLFDPESMYPYAGYRSTALQPKDHDYRVAVIENELLKVTVLPELGGRILQMEDVHTGRTYLHDNDVVRPVRIPPRWAYVSLGIELNFPTTHSPAGTEPLGYELIEKDDGSAGVAVGERELRWGLSWRAEITLHPGFRGVCVAVRGWNSTSVPRDVQWWSNAAQPAGGDTELVFPDEPVIAHLVGEESGQWPVVGGRDLRWHRNFDQMCGMFWEPTEQDWFGIYHHEQGWGLLHLADPAKLPGKKLWSFGYTGDTTDWSLAMTRHKEKTMEIQSGIPTLQQDFIRLEAEQDLAFVEFWLPVDARDELDIPKRPSFSSVAAGLGGTEGIEAVREELRSPVGVFWKDLAAAYRSSDAGWLKSHSATLTEIWPPSDPDLEPALRWAMEREGGHWRYQLSLWLCAAEQWSQAHALLTATVTDEPEFAQARAILGLLLWKALERPQTALPHLEQALAKLPPDGQLFFHANALLREMGLLEERKKLLKLWPKDDFRRTETEAEIALDSGDAEGAIRILTEETWERHHCRHRRTELWRAGREQLGQPTTPVPLNLMEDPLAVDEGPVDSRWSEASE